MKAYIIHLPDFLSSVLSANELKKSLKDINIDAVLFDGSPGDITKNMYSKNKISYHHFGIKGPISNNNRALLWGNPGEMGCFDSHRRLWQLCVNLDEPIMIFEDDIIITRPYIDVEWDEVLSIAFSHSKKMKKYQDFLYNSPEVAEAKEYKQVSMPGNGGYIIKPAAALKLLNEYKQSYLPADNAINQHIVKIQIHSHMIGYARSKHDGNISLIKTNAWNN